ncbi:MAG: hypothetical protein MUC79_00670 [Thiobacillaceae bacterium]|nr:hypothetical protein [Thiobacillaceae bacterium]
MKPFWLTLGGIAAFALYVWLSQEMYAGLMLAHCRENAELAGAAHACAGPQSVTADDFGSHASYWTWLMLLGLPALGVAVGYLLVVLAVDRLARRMRRPRSRRHRHRL